MHPRRQRNGDAEASASLPDLCCLSPLPCRQNPEGLRLCSSRMGATESSAADKAESCLQRPLCALGQLAPGLHRTTEDREAPKKKEFASVGWKAPLTRDCGERGASGLPYHLARSEHPEQLEKSIRLTTLSKKLGRSPYCGSQNSKIIPTPNKPTDKLGSQNKNIIS